MTARWKLFAMIVAAGLIVDQATKLYIHKSMFIYQTIPVIPDIFNIFYIRNRGAAFSFLANVSWRLPFFILVSTFASAVILVAFCRLKESQKTAQTALALIFSGAVGNLIDRVRLGEVIDFLDFHWKTHHWPAFNVADSCIFVGVALLAFDLLREERRKKGGTG